jgi:hypothetical protein
VISISSCGIANGKTVRLDADHLSGSSALKFQSTARWVFHIDSKSVGSVSGGQITFAAREVDEAQSLEVSFPKLSRRVVIKCEVEGAKIYEVNEYDVTINGWKMLPVDTTILANKTILAFEIKKSTDPQNFRFGIKAQPQRQVFAFHGCDLIY